LQQASAFATSCGTETDYDKEINELTSNLNGRGYVLKHSLPAFDPQKRMHAIKKFADRRRAIKARTFDDSKILFKVRHATFLHELRRNNRLKQLFTQLQSFQHFSFLQKNLITAKTNPVEHLQSNEVSKP